MKVLLDLKFVLFQAAENENPYAEILMIIYMLYKALFYHEAYK